MAGKVIRQDYVRSETDLFTEPGYDLSINSTCTTEYHPISTLTQSAPIEFVVQGNDQQYLDMSKTKLKIRAKVVDSNGANLTKVPVTTTTNYAPVNNLIASAFDRVTVQLCDTEVTPKNSLNPYQAYLETLLSYGSDYKKGQAEAGGFFRVKDEALQTDEGWVKRKTLCDGSAEFELIGRPTGDVFTQQRYLMPGVDVRVTFYRATNTFCMESSGTDTKDVKLIILSAKLFIEKVSLLPSIHMNHIKMWQKHPAVYPNKRSVMRSYSLPIGTFQHANESLLSGLIPDRLIIGLVGSDNAQGTYGTNPFNFEDHGLNQITIYCNSEVPTQKTIYVNKSKGLTLDGFISLFDAMGISNCDSGLDIRLEEYLKEKALYGFDLRNLSDGFALPRHGNASINLTFGTKLAASVNVMVLAEYPSTMYISHDKQVYFKDYAKEI